MTPERSIVENRSSFLARVEPLHAPSIKRRIMLAYDRSKENHRHQKRKGGDRYFEHPRAVALILIDELGCIDPDLICAALLHDTIEDTRLSAEEIEQMFGERVCRIVVRLSKVPKEGYHERLEKFGEWEELMIKLCDRLHNYRSMGNGTTPEWRRKQYLETRDIYIALFERIPELAPVRYRTAIRRAVDEIISRTRQGLRKKPQARRDPSRS